MLSAPHAGGAYSTEAASPFIPPRNGDNLPHSRDQDFYPCGWRWMSLVQSIFGGWSAQ